MADNIAVVIGATGLIGSQLVQKLLEDPYFSKVRIIVRHWEQPAPPRLEVVKSDFSPQQLPEQVGHCSVIFSCMGTTRKNVKGDLNLYRKIDVDIPAQVAKAGKQQGAGKFLIVSSVGADINSNNYYLRYKGEVEAEVAAVQYDETHVFRPSFLIGDRKENRLMEKIMNPLMQGLSFLFAGKLSKYRAIHSTDVVKAMLAASRQHNPGLHIYHYKEIRALSSGDAA